MKDQPGAFQTEDFRQWPLDHARPRLGVMHVHSDMFVKVPGLRGSDREVRPNDSYENKNLEEDHS